MTGKLPSVNLQVRGLTLNNLESRRIDRHLARLAQRFSSANLEASIALILEWQPLQQRVEARLRVQEGHLGPKHVADASATTADKPVRIAAARIERRRLRRDHRKRGTASYGVPSRRFPERSRRSRALQSGLSVDDKDTGGHEAGDSGATRSW